MELYVRLQERHPEAIKGATNSVTVRKAGKQQTTTRAI